MLHHALSMHTLQQRMAAALLLFSPKGPRGTVGTFLGPFEDLVTDWDSVPRLGYSWKHFFTRQGGVCCGRYGALDPLSSSRAWLLPCQKNLVCLWLAICIVHTYHLSNDLLCSNWCSLQESREKSSPFPKSSWAIFNFKRKELTAKPSSLSLGRQRWLLESVLDLAHSSAYRSVWRWRW